MESNDSQPSTAGSQGFPATVSSQNLDNRQNKGRRQRENANIRVQGRAGPYTVPNSQEATATTGSQPLDEIMEELAVGIRKQNSKRTKKGINVLTSVQHNKYFNTISGFVSELNKKRSTTIQKLSKLKGFKILDKDNEKFNVFSSFTQEQYSIKKLIFTQIEHNYYFLVKRFNELGITEYTIYPFVYYDFGGLRHYIFVTQHNGNVFHILRETILDGISNTDELLDISNYLLQNIKNFITQMNPSSSVVYIPILTTSAESLNVLYSSVNLNILNGLSSVRKYPPGRDPDETNCIIKGSDSPVDYLILKFDMNKPGDQAVIETFKQSVSKPGVNMDYRKLIIKINGELMDPLIKSRTEFGFAVSLIGPRQDGKFVLEIGDLKKGSVNNFSAEFIIHNGSFVDAATSSPGEFRHQISNGHSHPSLFYVLHSHLLAPPSSPDIIGVIYLCATKCLGFHPIVTREGLYIIQPNISHLLREGINSSTVMNEIEYRKNGLAEAIRQTQQTPFLVYIEEFVKKKGYHFMYLHRTKMTQKTIWQMVGLTISEMEEYRLVAIMKKSSKQSGRGMKNKIMGRTPIKADMTIIEIDGKDHLARDTKLINFLIHLNNGKRDTVNSMINTHFTNRLKSFNDAIKPYTNLIESVNLIVWTPNILPGIDSYDPLREYYRTYLTNENIGLTSRDPLNIINGNEKKNSGSSELNKGLVAVNIPLGGRGRDD
jgi:hypothetical protein